MVDCIYCNDKGMSKPTCGLYGGLCPGIIEACEGREPRITEKDGYEPIPDCAYSHDDDLRDLLMCSKWGGPDTCIGYVNCSEYRPKGEEKPLSSIHLPKCKHRALHRPEYCGGPCTTAEGFKCVGETMCLLYEEGNETTATSNFEKEYVKSLIPTTDDAYDVVFKPSHYTEGRKYEPKDVIRDWELNFNLGNTVKYVARAGRKDDILQDLKKARQYLDFEIEYLEKEREEK